MTSKLNKIREILKEKNIESCILTSQQGRYWLSEFNSSFGFLVITKDNTYFFLDGRYYEKGKRELNNSNINVILYKDKNTLKDFFYSNEITSCLLEEEYTTLYELGFFQDMLDEIIPISSKSLRIEKTEKEIEYIRKAAKTICDVMEWIKLEIKAGMTEKEVANMISCKIINSGGEKNSFEPIVASGVNGSFPHHKPTDKIIEEGEFVTIDIGCMYKSYCSDLTRTIPIGNPTSKELIEAYDIVLKSNEEGIDKATAGITGKALDKISRDVISGTKYKEYFIHSTGHGVGIDVHELPNVSPVYENQLPKNSIVTIEPGIYIPNVGGIRIEDMVLILENGREVLTSSTPKKRYW